MAAVRLRDERMEGAKSGVVVLFTAKRPGARRGPGGTGSPRLDVDLTVLVHQTQRGGTFGRESRAPYLAVPHAQGNAGADGGDGQR